MQTILEGVDYIPEGFYGVYAFIQAVGKNCKCKRQNMDKIVF